MWALDELERVLGGETLRSSLLGQTGGEWDSLRLLPARTRRRLIGARYATPGGLAPDQLAELVRGRVAGIHTTDDAIMWYVRTCLTAIDEARLLAGRRRKLAVARRNGHLTYYQYRTELARAKGYGSVWDERRMRKWT